MVLSFFLFRQIDYLDQAGAPLFQQCFKQTLKQKLYFHVVFRNCHKCGKGIVKETGCNKMKCVCGALMCYICRKPVQDYTHFNGQGGDNYDRQVKNLLAFFGFKLVMKIIVSCELPHSILE